MTQEKRQTQIVRTANIVVESVAKDTYGNLIVTDKEGNEHKVGNKREHLFPVFQPDTAVHLSYAVYMDKEYIAGATPLDQMIKPPEKTPKVVVPENRGIAPQEKGMWWKEVGENFRAGLFKKDEGNGALLWKAYITQMLSSLEITIKGKED